MKETDKIPLWCTCLMCSSFTTVFAAVGFLSSLLMIEVPEHLFRGMLPLKYITTVIVDLYVTQ